MLDNKFRDNLDRNHDVGRRFLSTSDNRDLWCEFILFYFILFFYF